MNLSKTFSALMTNNNDAVIFFALVGFLTFNFSKNMTVVLLVSIISTNLLMVSRPFRSLEGFKEGARPKKGGNSTDQNDDLNNQLDSFVSGSKDDDEKSENGEEQDQVQTKPIIEGTTSKKNKAGFTNNLDPAPVKKSSHIDYATTLEDAYKNLEKMIGSGGLQNLTEDTKKLMDQQTQLFNSMENITPLLAQAQQMMKGMDVDSLNKFAGAAKSFNKTDA